MADRVVPVDGDHELERPLCTLYSLGLPDGQADRVARHKHHAAPGQVLGRVEGGCGGEDRGEAERGEKEEEEE